MLDRRGIFRKLLSLATLGITGVLLSQEKAGIIPRVEATPGSFSDGASSGNVLFADATNTSGKENAFEALAEGNGNAVYAEADGSGYAISASSWSSSAGYFVQNGGSRAAAPLYADPALVAGVYHGQYLIARFLNLSNNAGDDGSALVELYANANLSAYGPDSPFVWNVGVGGQANGLGLTSGQFYIENPTNTVRFLIDSSGHVGVGTTTPASPLEVAGLVKSSLGTAIGRPAINSSSILCASQDSWTVGEFSSHSASGNPQFYFYRSRGTRAALATVANGDYIGSLLANAYDGSAWGGSSGVAQIRFAIDGTVGTGSLPTRIVFATTPSGSNTPTERMRITNAGRVGIGTTSPSHLIQLAGGAYSDGSTWNPSSSVRWKENITPLTEGLDKLKQLHPVRYNYKKIPGKTTMGFIAEEVGKVLPTIVDWDPVEAEYAEGYDQTAILALAVNAIKELEKQNRVLMARIEALEKTKQSTLAI